MKIFECESEHCFTKIVADLIYKSFNYINQTEYIYIIFESILYKFIKSIEDYNFKNNKEYQIIVKIELHEVENGTFFNTNLR